MELQKLAAELAFREYELLMKCGSRCLSDDVGLVRVVSFAVDWELFLRRGGSVVLASHDVPADGTAASDGTDHPLSRYGLWPLDGSDGIVGGFHELP